MIFEVLHFVFAYINFFHCCVQRAQTSHAKLESEVLSLLSMVKEAALCEGKNRLYSYLFIIHCNYKTVWMALMSGQEVSVWGKAFSPLLTYSLLSNHKGIHFQAKINIPLVTVSCLDYVENGRPTAVSRAEHLMTKLCLLVLRP